MPDDLLYGPLVYSNTDTDILPEPPQGITLDSSGVSVNVEVDYDEAYAAALSGPYTYTQTVSVPSQTINAPLTATNTFTISFRPSNMDNEIMT